MHVEDSSKKLSAVDEVLLRAVAKSGLCIHRDCIQKVSAGLKRDCKIATQQAWQPGRGGDQEISVQGARSAR